MRGTAGQLLVEAMRCQGVDRVFCVPGESYLPVLDALRDRPDIDLVTCRHESGAGLMAVADAKLTFRAGTAMVSRGPGASNIAIAIHMAEQDAAPLVVFIGQVARADLGRNAFQEIDYRAMFGGMAKWVTEVCDADTVADTVVEAYRVAETGTPGPVVVSLPEDMLTTAVSADPKPRDPDKPALPDASDVAAVARHLCAARRPLLIAGGTVASQTARHRLEDWSKDWQVPVATSYKHQDVFTNTHPCFVGHLGFGLPPAAWQPLADADLIIGLGTRLNDITTQGYRLPTAPRPAQPLVHIHRDPTQLGRMFDTTLAVVSETELFVDALAALDRPEISDERRAWCTQRRDAYARLATWVPESAPDGVDFGHVIAALAQHLPADATLTMDAGNFGSWLHRYFPFQSSQRLLGAVSGGMGFGVPAAVAAALREPSRPVVTIVGDGGMLMTGNELATAVQYRAPVKVFVADNRSYATIRLHQEKAFPGRVVGTALQNPRFATLAEAFGARGLAVDDPAQVDRVVREALATEGPVVVSVTTSLTHLSAFTKLPSDSLNRPH